MGLNRDSACRMWLLETIRTSCAGGENLVTASMMAGRQQYPWLLDQLRDRGEVEIIEGYHARRRAERAERTWQVKRTNLVTLDMRIASRIEAGLSGDSYSLKLQRSADRLRRSIEKHDRAQEGATDDRAEQ